jgi:RNA polymerase sigma-70 factor (ECF subfamily)
MSEGGHRFVLMSPAPTPRASEPREPDWDTLIRVHGHRVFVSLLALGLRPDRARDIAQTAWMRLIDKQRAGQLEELRFPGLAITQARFLALDELRRSKREGARHARVDADAFAVFADPAAGPEGRLIDREQLDRALRVLADASPNARRIFRLLYENPRMAHRECAEQVGLSLQRVRQILCETRAQMRRAIEEKGTP